ncbi:MAG: hypothetical protein AB1416_02755, partial [Actinomycetota bacterium]
MAQPPRAKWRGHDGPPAIAVARVVRGDRLRLVVTDGGHDALLRSGALRVPVSRVGAGGVGP